jgi:succinoglycan biosynthesis protein ExoM
VSTEAVQGFAGVHRADVSARRPAAAGLAPAPAPRRGRTDARGAELVRVDVCICTFRRPEALRTALDSIAAQDLPEAVRLRVVVIDNDNLPTARETVREAAREHGLTIDYVHAPAHNISLARNAALEAARGDWIAMMDDDGVAPTDWITRLLAAAHRTGADVVFGPCAAVYPPQTPEWILKGDFHSTKLDYPSEKITTGYTGNALIRRPTPALSATRFDLRRGRTGGEDTDFFHRLHKAGARLAYAQDAVVQDVIAPDRVNLGWLVTRWFRSGQSHATLRPVGAATPEGFVRASVSLAKALFCGSVALVCMGCPVRHARWLLRGALHAGAFCRRWGLAEREVY